MRTASILLVLVTCATGVAGEQATAPTSQVAAKAEKRGLSTARISLDVKDMPFENVLKNIEAQLQTRITFSAGIDKGTRNQLTSIKLKEIPFWEAIAKLSKETGFGFVPGSIFFMDEKKEPVENFVLLGPSLIDVHSPVELKSKTGTVSGIGILQFCDPNELRNFNLNARLIDPATKEVLSDKYQVGEAFPGRIEWLMDIPKKKPKEAVLSLNMTVEMRDTYEEMRMKVRAGEKASPGRVTFSILSIEPHDTWKDQSRITCEISTVDLLTAAERERLDKLMASRTGKTGDDDLTWLRDMTKRDVLLNFLTADLYDKNGKKLSLVWNLKDDTSGSIRFVVMSSTGNLDGAEIVATYAFGHFRYFSAEVKGVKLEEK